VPGTRRRITIVADEIGLASAVAEERASRGLTTEDTHDDDDDDDDDDDLVSKWYSSPQSMREAAPDNELMPPLPPLPPLPDAPTAPAAATGATATPALAVTSASVSDDAYYSALLDRATREGRTEAMLQVRGRSSYFQFVN
jgi:hypothetical protein